MTDISTRKEHAAFWSVVASALLTMGKLVAGLLTGSLALISEAGHSLLDTGATILTYFAVKASDRPADNEHHFGHAKIEAVAALAETVLLFLLSIAVLYEAISRLLEQEHHIVHANLLAFTVLIISISTDFIRWRSLHKVAQETKSYALEADALHFASDMIGSGLVLIGLIAVYFGFESGDAIASLGVAGFISIAGYHLGKKTIDTLVDTAPKGLAEIIRKVILDVTGVISIDYIRLRPSGAQVIGEIGIYVARTLAFEQVVRVKDEVGTALRHACPDVQATITANPLALNDESVLERVLLVAARRRIPIHHVTVQEIDGHTSVSLDLEVDGTLSLNVAHEIASALEKAIADEIGTAIEVETHIEPMEVHQLSATNAADSWTQTITIALSQYAAREGIIKDIHNVRVRESNGRLLINYHCRTEGDLSINDTHKAVDAMEHSLRADYPHITRLVGHAEPIRHS